MTRPTFEHAVLRSRVRLANGRVGRLWSMPGPRYAAAGRRARVELLTRQLVEVDPDELTLVDDATWETS